MRRQRLARITLPDYVPSTAATTTGASTPRSSARAPTSAWARTTSTCTTSGPWRAWAPSRTARASTWARSDKVIMANRRVLLKAIETVRPAARRRWCWAPTAAAALHGPGHHRLHRAGRRLGRVLAPAGGGQARRRRRGCSAAATEPAHELPSRSAAACTTRRARSLRRGAAAHARAAARTGAHRLVRPARPAARQDADAARAALAALRRRRRHGQHAAAEGHARTAPRYRCSSRARWTNCRASARPTTCCCCPTRPACGLLPWAAGTGWLRAQPWFSDGTPVPSRPAARVAGGAGATCRGRASGLRCGLEVEFHIYRIVDAAARPGRGRLARRAARACELIHPGYKLLGEAWADLADEPLAHRAAHRAGPGPAAALARDRTRAQPGRSRVRRHRRAHRRRPHGAVPQRRAPGAAARRLPRQLRLPAAVPERDGQRLAPAPVAGRRRPTAATPSCAKRRPAARRPTQAHSAVGPRRRTGSPACWRMRVARPCFGTPTVNGYGRFQAERDGAAVGAVGPRQPRRDVAGAGRARATPATRIENRIGEPMANPYLYMASQMHCRAGRPAAPARTRRRPPIHPTPTANACPSSLGEALRAFGRCTCWPQPWVRRWCTC